MLLVSGVFVLIAFGLGASIGYDISSGRTLTISETQTASTTTTQTATTSVTVISGQTYAVLTITKQGVAVYQYEPICVTTSNRTEIAYTQVLLAVTTTVTYILPSRMPNSTIVSVTTVTNNNFNLFSATTYSQSISC